MADCAVIWDFDGTLVDTRHRNLSVNRSIVESFAGRSWGDFEALLSIEAYDAAVARCTNWRDFYRREFGLREDDLEAAGRLWTDLHLTDPTPVNVFPGVPEVLRALSHVPHAIVSQNARAIIRATLEALDLADRFVSVKGYEEVAPGRQKPAPDALLSCLDELLDGGPARALYVGDHATDALCVARARAELEDRGSPVDVRSVAVLYGGESIEGWPEPPHYVARSPTDVASVVNSVAPGAAARVRSPGE